MKIKLNTLELLFSALDKQTLTRLTLFAVARCSQVSVPFTGLTHLSAERYDLFLKAIICKREQ